PTASPRSSSRRATWKPMNPAAPVTRTRISAGGGGGRKLAPAADRVIGDALPLHPRRIVEVAAVEDDGLPQPVADQVEIGGAEDLPFGHDHEGIRLAQGGLLGAAEHQVLAVAVDPLGLLHRLGIIGLDARARLPERLHDDAGGRLAHVVGVGLEGEAPEREGPALEIVAEMTADLVDEHPLLGVVAILDRLE